MPDDIPAVPPYHIVDGRVLDAQPFRPYRETETGVLADNLQRLFEEGLLPAPTADFVWELFFRIPDVHASGAVRAWHDITDGLVRWIRHDASLAEVLAAAIGRSAIDEQPGETSTGASPDGRPTAGEDDPGWVLAQLVREVRDIAGPGGDAVSQTLTAAADQLLQMDAERVRANRASWLHQNAQLRLIAISAELDNERETADELAEALATVITETAGEAPSRSHATLAVYQQRKARRRRPESMDPSRNDVSSSADNDGSGRQADE